jgi:hypothetical protein
MRRQRRAIYRKLREEEKQAYWYVDLPPDRPTKSARVPELEWTRMVDDRIVMRDDGQWVRYCPFSDEQIVVGSPEWKQFLVDLITRSRYRMFWEAPRRRVVEPPQVIYRLFGDPLYPGTPEYLQYMAEERPARLIHGRARRHARG